jgi:DNA-binding transcriptional ArsR family regulator
MSDVMTYAKTNLFDKELQKLATVAKSMAHPARLAILKYLAEQKVCISGDISDVLPLSRTTVSQHLQELKKADLIVGTIDGLKINYCLNTKIINEMRQLLDGFMECICCEDDSCC